MIQRYGKLHRPHNNSLECPLSFINVSTSVWYLCYPRTTGQQECLKQALRIRNKGTITYCVGCEIIPVVFCIASSIPSPFLLSTTLTNTAPSQFLCNFHQEWSLSTKKVNTYNILPTHGLCNTKRTLRGLNFGGTTLQVWWPRYTSLWVEIPRIPFSIRTRLFSLYLVAHSLYSNTSSISV